MEDLRISEVVYPHESLMVRMADDAIELIGIRGGILNGWIVFACKKVMVVKLRTRPGRKPMLDIPWEPVPPKAGLISSS